MFKKTTAPADTDFPTAANQFTDSTGFGNTASYGTVFFWAGTQANPSLVGTAASTANSSPDFLWNATGNKASSDLRLLYSSIQYYASESTSNAAATAVDMLVSYAGTAYCGVWTDTSGSGASAKGPCALVQ